MGIRDWFAGQKHDLDLFNLGYDIGEAAVKEGIPEVTEGMIRGMAEDEGYSGLSDKDYDSVVEGVEQGIYEESTPWYKVLFGL